jgi:alkylation response protein AidB-like acyl-CoA dehydrogenase
VEATVSALSLHRPDPEAVVPTPPEFLRVDCGAYTSAAEALATKLAATAVERDKRGGTALAERALIRQSGLLNLSVPPEFGGPGERWPLIYRIVRRLAAADSSMAHLYGFQHLQIATLLLFANPAQQQRYLRGTIEHNWFWGNATNALDGNIALQPASDTAGDHYTLHGLKTFCSGALDSDMLNVSAPRGGDPANRLIVTIPTRRSGIHANEDWDTIGQRQTDSGSVRFDQVRVEPDEILGPPGPGGSPRATLRPCVSQLVLTEIYNGNALGALAAARAYVIEQGRPWFSAGVAKATDDPYVQQRYGDLWSKYRAAASLTESAAQTLQDAWDLGNAITPQQRGDVAVAIAEARVFAARTALEVTAQIFETMGARATASRWGFDRWWRNVRTHSLHDPLDYKLRDIGHWLLTGEPPVPSIYS